MAGPPPKHLLLFVNDHAGRGSLGFEHQFRASVDYRHLFAEATAAEMGRQISSRLQIFAFCYSPGGKRSST